MWFITTNFWGADPRGLSADITFSRGNHIISAFRAVSHTPLRDGRGERERSGAAWHPTRTGCEAEAASDNTPCWGCRQPLVHLFSPLNHGSQIESCCLATLYISVLLLTPCERSAKLNDQVFHTWNKFIFLSRRECQISCTSCCRLIVWNLWKCRPVFESKRLTRRTWNWYTFSISRIFKKLKKTSITSPSSLLLWLMSASLFTLLLRPHSDSLSVFSLFWQVTITASHHRHTPPVLRVRGYLHQGRCRQSSSTRASLWRSCCWCATPQGPASMSLGTVTTSTDHFEEELLANDIIATDSLCAEVVSMGLQ